MIEVRFATSQAERNAVVAFRTRMAEQIPGNPLAGDVLSKEQEAQLDETAQFLYAYDSDTRSVVGALRHHIGCQGLPTFWKEALGVELFYKGNWQDWMIGFISHVVIAHPAQGGDVLRKLFTHLYEHLQEKGMQFDFIHCAPSLLVLFEHLGYRTYKSNFLAPGAGYRIPLVLVVQDQDYLLERQSSLATISHKFSGDKSGPMWFRTAFRLGVGDEGPSISPDQFWPMLSAALERSAEAGLSFFQGLSTDDVRALVRTSSVLTCEPGDPVIRAGDIGQEMFVVLEGTLMIEKPTPYGHKKIAELESGQVFGEIAFVTSRVRTADVRATSRARVLVITPAQIEVWRHKEPGITTQLLLNLCKILSTRLADTTQKL